MAGLRQCKNPRRLLCKARLEPKPPYRPVSNSRSTTGWKSCSGNRKMCPICPSVSPPLLKLSVSPMGLNILSKMKLIVNPKKSFIDGDL